VLSHDGPKYKILRKRLAAHLPQLMRAQRVESENWQAPRPSLPSSTTLKIEETLIKKLTDAPKRCLRNLSLLGFELLIAEYALVQQLL